MPTIPAPRRRVHADRGAGRGVRDSSPRWVTPGGRHLLRNAYQVLTWCAVAAFVWLVLPTQYGGHVGTTIVSGHSMEPTYRTGDLVVTWRGTDVAPGDVVVYRVPQGEPGEGLHVVHRVDSVDAAGRFTMLGDNNDQPDLWTPAEADVVGEVVASVPQGGHWMRVLLSPLALALLCGVLVTWAVVSDGSRPRDPDEPGDPEDHDEPEGRCRDAGRRTSRRPGAFPGSRAAPARSHSPASPGSMPVARALVPVTGIGLLTLGLTVASAASLGTLDAADLTTARVSARPVAPVAGLGQVGVEVTRSDRTSYCAEVTVSTPSTAPIRWSAIVAPGAVSSNPVYRLGAEPSAVDGARTTLFWNGTWVVRGDGSNDVITAGSPATWSFCAPWSTSAPLADATASVRVTSESGNGPNARYCAEVTVSTTATDWQRWQVTIGSNTAGLAGPKYRLTSAPTPSDAVSVSFTGGNQWRWTVRGDATQPVVKAGAPAVWTYCK